MPGPGAGQDDQQVTQGYHTNYLQGGLVRFRGYTVFFFKGRLEYIRIIHQAFSANTKTARGGILQVRVSHIFSILLFPFW